MRINVSSVSILFVQHGLTADGSSHLVAVPRASRLSMLSDRVSRFCTCFPRVQVLSSERPITVGTSVPTLAEAVSINRKQSHFDPEGSRTKGRLCPPERYLVGDNVLCTTCTAQSILCKLCCIVQNLMFVICQVLQHYHGL